MARQIINVGTAPNDGTGDTLKTSFTKCNANFLELYSGSSITISDTAPGSPSNGSMWWESDTGTLWISYNDGNTVQWVAVAGGGSVVALAGPPQGRLTLQSSIPVMTTTITGATTIYYTPYVGAMVPIFDGTNFAMTTFTQISVATTDTAKNPAAIGANKCNDWFVWNDAGTLRLSHGPDWTNDTTRSAGTVLNYIYGFWTNSVAITNGPATNRGTYVGTTRSNATSKLDWKLPTAAVNGGQGLFQIWNAYNRVIVSGICSDATASWTYGSTTWRVSNNQLTNSIAFVMGLQEDGVVAQDKLWGWSDGSGNRPIIGIGVDVTTSPSGIIAEGSSSSAYSFMVAEHTATFTGAHTIYAIEAANAGAPVFYGLRGEGQMSGLTVTLRM